MERADREIYDGRPSQKGIGALRIGGLWVAPGFGGMARQGGGTEDGVWGGMDRMEGAWLAGDELFATAYVVRRSRLEEW